MLIAQQALVLLLLMTLLWGIFDATVFLLARRWNLRIVDVSLYIGPTIKSWIHNGVAFKLRCIPFGCSVEYWTERNQAEYPLPHPGDLKKFEELSLSRQIALAFSGPLAILGLSVLLTGWESGSYFVRGFHDFFSAAFGRPAAKLMIHHFFRMIRKGHEWNALGILAAKFAAFQLTPVPGSSSFAAINIVVRKKTGRDISDFGKKLNLGEFLAIAGIALYVLWATAVFSYWESLAKGVVPE